MELRHLTDDEIQDHLDGNLPAKNRFIQEHLKTCQFCQKAVAEYKSLYLELKDEKGFKLSRNFAQSVISRIPKQPAAKSRFSYVEALLVVLGIVAAGFTTIHLVDFRPLIQRITALPLPHFEFVSAFFGSVTSLLQGLNINSSLIIFSALTLLIIKALDYIILHPKEKPISSLI